MEYQMLEGMNFPPKTRNEVQERMTRFITLNGGDTIWKGKLKLKDQWLIFAARFGVDDEIHLDIGTRIKAELKTRANEQYCTGRIDDSIVWQQPYATTTWEIPDNANNASDI